MHSHTCYTHTHAQPHSQEHMHTHTHAIHTHPHIHSQEHMHSHMLYTHTDIYTYKNTYTHTHTHKQTHSHTQSTDQRAEAAWCRLPVGRELSGPHQPPGMQCRAETCSTPLGAASSPSDSCPGASTAGKYTSPINTLLLQYCWQVHVTNQYTSTSVPLASAYHQLILFYFRMAGKYTSPVNTLLLQLGWQVHITN